jgi:hypothetical protein
MIDHYEDCLKYIMFSFGFHICLTPMLFCDFNMIPFIVLTFKSLVDNIENENESCIYKVNVFKNWNGGCGWKSQA